MLTDNELQLWEHRFRAFVAERLSPTDPAHDLTHVMRVVANGRRLAAAEGGLLEVVVPAAWLHDCVAVPKNDPRRAQASRLAAIEAERFLGNAGYPAALIPLIAHAIEAHSFSAQVSPNTLEARIVQDADRLDSLGAIGITRCILTGASFGAALYDPLDPFAENRPPDEYAFSLDHFYVKLLRLAEQMQTPAGRHEAAERTTFLIGFLEQLKNEIAG